MRHHAALRLRLRAILRLRLYAVLRLRLQWAQLWQHRSRRNTATRYLTLPLLRLQVRPNYLRLLLLLLLLL